MRAFVYQKKGSNLVHVFNDVIDVSYKKRTNRLVLWNREEKHIIDISIYKVTIYQN